MDHLAVIDQTLVEQNMLGQLVEGLRAVMARGDQDPADTLLTLRFIAHALQRHLDRVVRLEEDGGYLGWVVEMHPGLSRSVSTLRAEHERFRSTLARVVARMDSASDAPELERISTELRVLLQRLEEHSEKEGELLQEAVQRDGGGEG